MTWDEDDFEVDFFGIGAPKAASTWLHRVLDDHPEITIARVKEPQFFVKSRAPYVPGTDPEDNPRFLDDWDWYRDQFKHADPDDLLGDMSVNMLHNVDTAPELIHEHYPEARFVLTLRDPVARTYSAYWHVRRHGDEPVAATFEAWLDEATLTQSRYHALLEHWIDVFPRDRFHVGTVLDLKEDPVALAQGFYDFLGVDPTHVPAAAEERVNPAHESSPLYEGARTAAETLHRWGLGPLVDAANRVGIDRLVEAVGTEETEYPPLDPDLEAELREEFRPDVEALEDLLDRDLSPWLPGGQGAAAEADGETP